MSRRRQAAARAPVLAVADELGLVHPRLSRLEGGALSRVWRLRDAHRDLVLRLADPRAAALGADQAAGHALQRLAARAGLAPQVVLARPQQGLLVSCHAPGRPLARLRDSGQLARVGAWIARLQALPPPSGLPAVDLGARAAVCLATLARRAPARALPRLARRLARRRARIAPAPPVCCHHDLHRRNLVDDGARLLAVDWEYAGPGDPAADLAGFIGYHRLDQRGLAALLAGYGRDDAALRGRLAALGWIFDCLWYGWNALAALAGVAADAALQERLEAGLLA